MKRLAPLILIAAAVTTIAGPSSADTHWVGEATMKWCGDPIGEIASADITRDGRVFTIKMESRIDAAPDTVWAAMKHPELFSKNSEQYRKSDLLKDEGNHKDVEFHETLLTHLQHSVVSMDFDDVTHTLKIKTLRSSDHLRPRV